MSEPRAKVADALYLARQLVALMAQADAYGLEIEGSDMDTGYSVKSGDTVLVTADRVGIEGRWVVGVEVSP